MQASPFFLPRHKLLLVQQAQAPMAWEAASKAAPMPQRTVMGEVLLSRLAGTPQRPDFRRLAPSSRCSRIARAGHVDDNGVELRVHAVADDRLIRQFIRRLVPRSFLHHTAFERLRDQSADLLALQ